MVDLNQIDMTHALCAGKYKSRLKHSDSFKGFHNGDSGGPLTTTAFNGQHTLLGVMVAGPGNDLEYRDGPSFLFARVNQHLSFIGNTINKIIRIIRIEDTLI